MTKNNLIGLAYICLLLIGTASNLQAQSATISGVVIDSLSNEPLPGAAVQIGTSAKGAATNLDGAFYLPKVPIGEVTLRIMYIGYKDKFITLNLKENEERYLDIRLQSDVNMMNEIVVVINLEGQQKALNQQRTSDRVMNVISSDVMGRFPDLNVAEALQRVPGVNISRSRGEGSTVSLRGTPTHFTSININGEQIPSTQDNGSRNESLDLIPADQIASMEIVKAITSDMDGDAIGGSINLRTPKAKSMDWEMKAETGGGYNALAQSYNGIGRFKIGRRFFADNDSPRGKLGLQAGLSYFETDNEEDEQEIVWSAFNDTPIVGLGIDTVVIENHEVNDLLNQRTRTGATFTLDYEFNPDSDIIFNFIYSRRKDIDEQNRLRTFLNQSAGVQWESLSVIRGAELRRDLALREYYSENFSYNLEGRHKVLGRAIVDWGMFYADSRRVEDALNGRFERGPQNRIDLQTTTSDGIFTDFVGFQTYESDIDFFDPFIINELNRYDRVDLNLDASNMVAKANFELPYNVGNATATFKTGFKLRSQSNDRIRRNDIYNYSDPNRVLDPREGFASIISSFEDEDFLNGNLRFGPSINPSLFRDFIDRNEQLYLYDTIRSNRNTFNDTYSATEDIYAAYVMNRFQFNKLMILLGLRYETNRVNYEAYSVNNITGDATPLTDGTTYDFLLPNVHFKYAVNPLTIIRTAFTFNYARANFSDIVPFLNIDEEGSRLIAGNPELKPAGAFNADLMFERYLGNVGILSLGAFYKNIDDFQFTRNLRFLRPGDPFFDRFPGYQLRQEQNGEVATVYGLEVNAQTNLSFMPGVLKGISLFFNYTYTASDATTSDRSGINLPGQADHTWNASLGYDYKKFSAKASANYNGSFLNTVAGEARNDLIQEDRLQLDLNASLTVGKHIRLFGEFMNVTNAPAILYQGNRDRIAAYAYFGWWNRFGVSYSL